MKFKLGFSFTETLSVIGIIALLTSAGAHMLVDIINESTITTCYVTAQNIERAEQLYYLTNHKHSTEYNILGLVTKNSLLVKEGYLNIQADNSCTCSYKWVNGPNNKHIICLNCHELKPNSTKMIQLLQKYLRQKTLSDSEYTQKIVHEYMFIEQYYRLRFN